MKYKSWELRSLRNLSDYARHGGEFDFSQEDADIIVDIMDKLTEEVEAGENSVAILEKKIEELETEIENLEDEKESLQEQLNEF